MQIDSGISIKSLRVDGGASEQHYYNSKAMSYGLMLFVEVVNQLL